MDNSKNFWLNLFFPEFCLGCAREGCFLCEDCRSLLDICEFDYCLCDHAPRLPILSKGGKCPKCSNKKMAGLYFALPYKENSLTKKLIRQFKYEPHLKSLAPVLASILAEHFIKTGKNTDEIWAPGGTPAILIPVPLHAKKLRERGYNQSEELAKELSKILQIPALTDVLEKIKPTAPQMELKKEERQKNLQGVFAIKNPAELQDKKIFLVDDVYTTGCTMEECARVLRDAGAESVWGICVSRES